MGFGWAVKNISPIGIDFGADSIKLLQIVPEDPPRLMASASVGVPDDARRAADRYRAFASHAIRDLVREGRFKGRRAVASISAAQSFVRHVRLTTEDPALLEQQVEAELQGRLPLDPSALVIRNVVVGDVETDRGVMREVICLAASRDAVLRQVQVVRSAGLEVVGMHGEPMAILAAFGHLFRRANDTERTTFFIDIGAATTKALIAHGRELVFAKTIQVAGDHFARQLAQQAGVDLSEARLRRIREASAAAAPPAPAALEPTGGERRRGGGGGGVRTIDGGLSGGDSVGNGSGPEAGGGGAPAMAAAVTSEMLDALVDELQLCVGYHRSMFPERPIDKVIFLGGESRQTPMCQRIAQALGVAAQLGDPLARLIRVPTTPPPVGVDLRESQPSWAVPLGMCLLPTNL